MSMARKLIGLSAGAAAFAAAAPATAQYYGYSNPYAYGGGVYGVNASVAAQQCTAAVQNRLYNRTSLGQILGSLVGIPTASSGQVLSVTQERRDAYGGMRIRGLASSGRYAYNSYGPYGVGAYGALGYGAASQADLSFRCDVDNRGFVRNVDIRRRY